MYYSLFIKIIYTIKKAMAVIKKNKKNSWPLCFEF